MYIVKKISILGLILGSVFFFSKAFSTEELKALSASDQKTVNSVIKELQTGSVLEISGAFYSHLPNFFVVFFHNNPVTLYVEKSGRYFFVGELFGKAKDNKNFENLTTDSKSFLVKASLAFSKKVLKEAIVFPSTHSSKQSKNLYVFTDVDCGFCRKFHENINEYNRLGFNVHYLAYPRAGLDSVTGKQMQSAWCSEDSKKALTQLKSGQKIASSSCPQNISAQYELGMTIGIQGTPTLIFDDGRLLPGYVSPEQLKSMIE